MTTPEKETTRLDGDVIDPPPWTQIFQPKPATSLLPSSPLTTAPTTASTTTTTTTTAKSEPFIIDTMSDPLAAQPQPPNGTQPHHHASYAETAAHNAPPVSAQPHADKNLLYTGPSPTRPTSAPDVETKVSVVPHDWAAHPTTETSLHVDVVQSETDTASDDDDDNISGSTKRKARKQRERSHKLSKPKRDRDVKPFWRYSRPGLIGGVISFRPYIFLPSKSYISMAPNIRTAQSTLASFPA